MPHEAREPDRPSGRGHIPVLLGPVVNTLGPQPGETVLDCTAGLGGHAAALAARIGPRGTLILNDLDPANLERAAARVREIPDAPAIVLWRGNFADAPRRACETGLSADVVLSDLGFSSNQIEDPIRGFSFMRPGPLDMRLDPNGPVTAAELVKSLPEEELAGLIQEYGEERRARAIAQKLVAVRRERPIDTTEALASLVRSVVGPSGGIDPATRTFQALRIAVNDELGNLRAWLDALQRPAAGRSEWLRPGARLGVISFHSLEDRMVKEAFRSVCETGQAQPLTRRPIEASEAEIVENPRSRSAKFRAIRMAVGAVL